MSQILRKVKLQEELDPNFKNEIESIEGCENLNRCIQCGACSGTCPLSIYMDIPPRKIIEMVVQGFREEALSSFTIWLCASCYACNVHCPQQIRITDVMYMLKRMAIKEKIYPKNFPMPILSKEFFNMVMKSGRNSEFQLILRVWLQVSIFKLIGMAPLGWDLIRKRRLSFKKDSIKNRNELALILGSLNGTK